MKFINGEKLRNEIKKRGLTPAEMSRNIGHASNYLSKTIVSGKIEDHCMKVLESMYNIKSADISDEKTDDLEEKIYRAVLRALIETKMGV